MVRLVRRIPVLLGLLLAATLAAPALADPPAALAKPDPTRARALASFERFAESWMAEMRQHEARARANGNAQRGFRGVGSQHRVSLKATGNPRIPWVGMLRYAEHEYACRSAGCSRAASRTVTEVFRFQGGRWVY